MVLYRRVGFDRLEQAILRGSRRRCAAVAARSRSTRTRSIRGVTRRSEVTSRVTAPPNVTSAASGRSASATACRSAFLIAATTASTYAAGLPQLHPPRRRTWNAAPPDVDVRGLARGGHRRALRLVHQRHTRHRDYPVGGAGRRVAALRQLAVLVQGLSGDSGSAPLSYTESASPKGFEGLAVTALGASAHAGSDVASSTLEQVHRLRMSSSLRVTRRLSSAWRDPDNPATGNADGQCARRRRPWRPSVPAARPSLPQRRGPSRDGTLPSGGRRLWRVLWHGHEQEVLATGGLFGQGIGGEVLTASLSSSPWRSASTGDTAGVTNSELAGAVAGSGSLGVRRI